MRILLKIKRLNQSLTKYCIAKAAFNSEEMLFLVAGHELVHVGHLLRGLDIKFSSEQYIRYTKGAAWKWTLEAWHDNHWMNSSGLQDLSIWEGFDAWGKPFIKNNNEIKSLFNSGAVRKIFKK